MAPATFRQALTDLGLTQQAAARFFDVDERTVRRWATGAGDVPRSVALVFALMKRFSISVDELAGA